ncbi:MAG: hypothetical protein NTX81_02060, partial [Candidatus Bathyarchaeota archaeon]|nr:hypothetical protein [Candidatus Bathyarchaeota archaeon]
PVEPCPSGSWNANAYTNADSNVYPPLHNRQIIHHHDFEDKTDNEKPRHEPGLLCSTLITITHSAVRKGITFTSCHHHTHIIHF